MTILCVGVDHSSAPLALRERLSVAADELDRVLAAAVGEMPLVRECVLLSTCNRVELYATAADSAVNVHACVRQIGAYITRCRGLPADDLTSALRYYEGCDAAQHLCRVAAGLESLVIGEAEILGQVADALERAQRLRTARSTLSTLFDTALRAGKRARLETALGHNPASVSSVAIKLAEELAPHVTDNQALVIGAGKMGRIGVSRLCASGRWQVTVTSRTSQRADVIAAARDVTLAPFHDLKRAIAAADVVFAATSAASPIIDEALVAEVMAVRGPRPLVFIDVGVPRNVHSAVRTLHGVSLYDMDDLRSGIEQSLQQRRQEIPAVEAIIAEELQAFEQRAQGANLLRLVQEWRQSAEAIRRREVEQLRAAVPHLEPELERHIERLTVSLVNRLLDEPTRRLRAEASNGHAEEVAALAQRLLRPEAPGPAV